MLADVSPEEMRRALDRVAEDLLWEAAVDRPPVDAFRVAHELGLRVIRDERIAERGRFVRGVGTAHGAVVLGAEARPERRHWAVAHEVGEAFCHRLFELVGADPLEAGVLREEAANALAGRLLVPRRWLARVYLDTNHNLFHTKQVFATASHELIARRLIEALDEPLVVSLFDHDQLVWRRSTAVGTKLPLLRSERLGQRRAHLLGQPVLLDAAATDSPLLRSAIVRCWPIHEPGWKREILFTELGDGLDLDLPDDTYHEPFQPDHESWAA
ncbi:ImmA/IrrE family metallo-endopeptidase [Botrimarina hoheduenensis]|uniref:IrrE N-terminal-like domain-containing protein n=1 Tax=Botrimarina hoheduenensis TaxID=2528000 RepID=A0A5C5WE34_9BACT|nr:ImmA/IrrE family metallo-endopeptidase [Botrimarina hoheduenensis]TWT48727.1 hypothetical protein Pla111_05020 [Botrimarina hoheduenensis]